MPVALDHTKETPTILLRCDGNRLSGHGHVSRSLALAEAFVDMGCECFFLGTYDGTTRMRLDGAGMKWISLNAVPWTADDASCLKALASKTHKCAVVTDSYVLGVEYLESLRAAGLPVLVIDDFAALDSYPCAAVLNFTSRASSFNYPHGAVRYFLGPAWFPARRTLREARAKGVVPVREAHKILVVSGSYDAHDIVLPVVDSLLSCEPNFDVHIVTTDMRAEQPALHARLALFNGDTRIQSQLPDLVSELAWADLCIATAGLVKYEAAYLGVPAALLSQNEGQALDAARFGELGLAIDLGSASRINPQQLTERISKLARDKDLLESLQRQCLSLFPIDATHKLATALLSEVVCPTGAN